MVTLITTGEDAAEVADHDWADLLEIPGTVVVNSITIINEGDWPGYWRLVSPLGETQSARLPAGSGEPGERRSAVSFDCPGLSGATLQVKRTLMAGPLTGLFAFAGK